MTLDWKRDPNGRALSAAIWMFEDEYNRLSNPIGGDQTLDEAVSCAMAREAPGLAWSYTAHFRPNTPVHYYGVVAKTRWNANVEIER